LSEVSAVTWGEVSSNIGEVAGDVLGFGSHGFDGKGKSVTVDPSGKDSENSEHGDGNGFSDGSHAINFLEDGSFNDGFAPYARFFKPIGITVSTVINSNPTVWIADAGNNRVRNITCAFLTFSTLPPTAEPSADPTLSPVDVPTKQPTEIPSEKPTRSPADLPGGKAKNVNAPKNPAKNVKAAAEGTSTSGVTALASSVSTGAYVMIAVFCFAGAAIGLFILYNRKRLVDMIFGETSKSQV